MIARIMMPVMLLLALVSVSLAQGPHLNIPKEVYPVQGYARLQPNTEAKAITYIAGSGVFPLPSDFIADKRWFLLDTSRLPVGRYKFTAVGSLNDEHTVVEFDVVVGDAPPTPVPPGPGPNPPGPNPPGPAPTPVGDGLRVLIVEEMSQRPLLPRSQQVALQSGALVETLNAACAKDEKGKPDWRHYDDDFEAADIALLPERWRKPYADAVALHRKENAPVILISNNKKNPPGILTKFPLTDTDAIELVNRFKD